MICAVLLCWASTCFMARGHEQAIAFCAVQLLQGLEEHNPLWSGNYWAGLGPSGPENACLIFPIYRDESSQYLGHTSVSRESTRAWGAQSCPGISGMHRSGPPKTQKTCHSVSHSINNRQCVFYPMKQFSWAHTSSGHIPAYLLHFTASVSTLWCTQTKYRFRSPHLSPLFESGDCYLLLLLRMFDNLM